MSLATRKLSEKIVTKQIVSFMQAHRWRAIRLQSGLFSRPMSQSRVRIGESGMPDWVFVRHCVSGWDEVLFLEIKATEGLLTDAQMDWHSQARRDGFEVRWFGRFEDFEEFYRGTYVP